MKATAAVLVVVVMLGGCATYGGSRTTAKVGGGLILAGLSAVAIGAVIARNERDIGPGLVIAIAGAYGLIAPGILLGLSGLIGMQVYPEPKAAPIPRVEAPDNRRRDHDECVERRLGELRAAEQVADRQQRAKRMLDLPVCAPAPARAVPPTPALDAPRAPAAAP